MLTGDAERMELHYDCTVDDVIAFNLYVMDQASRSRRQVMTRRLGWLILGAAAVVGAAVAMTRAVEPVWVAVGVLVGLLFYLIYPRLERRRAIDALRKGLGTAGDAATLGPQTLLVSPEGIFTTDRAGRSVVNWPAVEKVSETENHLFVHLSSMRALVIPRACFKSDEEQQALVQLIDKYRGEGWSISLPLAG